MGAVAVGDGAAGGVGWVGTGGGADGDVDLTTGGVATGFGFGVGVDRDGAGSGAGCEVTLGVTGAVTIFFTGAATLDWSPTDEVTRRPGFTATGPLVTGALVTLSVALVSTPDGVAEDVGVTSTTG